VNQRPDEGTAEASGQLHGLDAEHMQAIGQQIQAVWEGVADRLRDVHAALQRSGLLDDRPPADPRARALWLRQHRGTGPVCIPHAKRRDR